MISKFFIIALTFFYTANAYDVIWNTEYTNADCTGDIIGQNSQIGPLDVCLFGLIYKFNGTHVSVSTCGDIDDIHIRTFEVDFTCEFGDSLVLEENVNDLTALFFEGEIGGFFNNNVCHAIKGKHAIFNDGGVSKWFEDADCKSGFIGHERANFESKSVKEILEGDSGPKNRVMIIIGIMIAIPFTLLLFYAFCMSYKKRCIKKNKTPTNKSSFNS